MVLLMTSTRLEREDDSSIPKAQDSSSFLIRYVDNRGSGSIWSYGRLLV